MTNIIPSSWFAFNRYRFGFLIIDTNVKIFSSSGKAVSFAIEIYRMNWVISLMNIEECFESRNMPEGDIAPSKE